MSLWWASRDHLDATQVELIEELSLRESHLVLGPPGSGKTNVLLRRAQFVRTQQLPNVMVLTFTRSLAEFLKTGCYDARGREIFPPACISTLESWTRDLYAQHGEKIPESAGDLPTWKAALAEGAMDFSSRGRIPRFDALFVDEAQDLMPQEVELLQTWSDVLFFVGDDRQKIYSHTVGLPTIRRITPPINERTLPFHYRLAPEICEMADRILLPHSGIPLSRNSHYNGPRPGRIEAHGPLSRDQQVADAAERLKRQLRAYGDMIQQGDRLGIVVPYKADREYVFEILERDAILAGKAQIIRARTGEADDRGYDPSFADGRPIIILSEQGSKGLEFRAVHWLFCNQNDHHRKNENYYTVITRSKTSLDMYFDEALPQSLARAYSPPAGDLW